MDTARAQSVDGRRYSTLRSTAPVTFVTIRSYADATRFWLWSAAEILQIVLAGYSSAAETMDTLLVRLELGIPQEAVQLTEFQFELTRGEYLALLSAGLDTKDRIAAATKGQLEAALPTERVAHLLEAMSKGRN
jgi:hypothetical protein